MKKTCSVLFLLLLLFFCMKTADFLPGEDTAAGCFLCGMNEESLMSLYRGRNSLGILCTDRFSVLDIFEGERERGLRRRNAGAAGSSMRMVLRGELRGTITIAGEHDRGISEVRIELGEKDRLDLDDLQGKLCEACMEKFVRLQEEGEEGIPDVFLVDLRTAEIYSLSKSGHFYVGDYFVIVEAEAEQAETAKIAVTVVRAI